MASHHHHSSSSSFQALASRLLLLLTVLPLALAALAFLLQWRGGLEDPAMRWSPDLHEFPGMGSATRSSEGSDSSHLKSSDCVDVLRTSRTASFPYYREWKFDFGLDLRPKVTTLSSTFPL